MTPHRLVCLDYPGQERRRAWCSCGAHAWVMEDDNWAAARVWHHLHSVFPTMQVRQLMMLKKFVGPKWLNLMHS